MPQAMQRRVKTSNLLSPVASSGVSVVLRELTSRQCSEFVQVEHGCKELFEQGLGQRLSHTLCPSNLFVECLNLRVDIDDFGHSNELINRQFCTKPCQSSFGDAYLASASALRIAVFLILRTQGNSGIAKRQLKQGRSLRRPSSAPPTWTFLGRCQHK